MSTKRFQVALSFPGEQRAYVAQVANALAERLGREQVFYDEWYTAELARPNLNKYLQDLYHQQAELIVPFLCADYERKEWCGLELRAILDLLKQRQDQAIMPLRFDDSSVDGFLSIDGYIDLRQYTPEQTAAFILQRITPREQTTPTQLLSTPTAYPPSKVVSLGVAPNCNCLTTLGQTPPPASFNLLLRAVRARPSCCAIGLIILPTFRC